MTAAHRLVARALQATMMAQMLLGIARLVTAPLGLSVPVAVWRAHRVLGITIAVAAVVVLRPRPGVAPTRLRRAGRFIAFAPLLLGLAILAGLPLGPLVVPLHVVVALGALAVIDASIKQQLTPAPGAPPRAPDPTGAHARTEDPSHPEPGKERRCSS